MKELGGYFELENFGGTNSTPYHSHGIALNCARNALLFSAKSLSIKKVRLPYFLCDSVQNACKKAGLLVSFYRISKDFLPKEQEPTEDGEWLYIVNYYGQLTTLKIMALKNKYKRIIVDNVQDFFQEPVPGVLTIYSCRKWFGVSDGAYLFGIDKAKTDFENLETQSANGKLTHLIGRKEECASLYYNDFKKNDESFSITPIQKMSIFSQMVMGALDYIDIERKRNQNYLFLQELLGAANGVQFNVPFAPFCYPFYTKNAANIREKLAKQKIYIPTLWPNVLELQSKDENAFDYTKNILVLPCDQRYTQSDMEYIAQKVLYG